MSINTCNEGPTHAQVPYTTKNGVETEVDANMAFTLELLKRLGVETFYSCEGDKRTKTMPSSPAYILGNGRELLRLEMRIKRLAKQGKLSLEAYQTARFLFGRQHTISINHFISDSRGLISDSRGRVETRFELNFGDLSYHGGPAAEVSKLFSTMYGFRINWKWPMRKTSDVARLLAEVYQFA